MPLHAHPFKPAVKLVKILRHRQTGGAGLFPVADNQIQHKLFFPLDKRVAQQRNQIVGNRAVERVLEIEHARAAAREHQVADDVVAVHIYFGLRQKRRQQGIDCLLPELALFEIQGLAQLFGGKPFGKQIDFAQHDFAVVFGQHIGLGGRLKRYQFVDGFEQQGFVHNLARIVLHGGEVGGVAQIAERHKALRLVDVQHLRHVHHIKQFLHFEIRRDAHFVGRRVHADNGMAV